MGLGNKIDRMCAKTYLKVLRWCIEGFNKAKFGSKYCKDGSEEQVRELKIVTAKGALEQIEHLKETSTTATLIAMLLYYDDLVRIEKFLSENEL